MSACQFQWLDPKKSGRFGGIGIDQGPQPTQHLLENLGLRVGPTVKIKAPHFLQVPESPISPLRRGLHALSNQKYMPSMVMYSFRKLFDQTRERNVWPSRSADLRA